MKKFLSPVLLGLSSLTGIMVLVVTSLTVASHEEDKNLISESLEKIAQLKDERKEEQAVNASKLSRERNRNQDLENEVAQIKEECLQVSQNLDGVKSNLESIYKSVEDASLDMEETQADIKLAEQQLNSLRETVQQLKAELPRINDKISQALGDGEDFTRQKTDREYELKDYPEITEIIRRHYKRVLKEMTKYGLERPWLESGEVLALKFSSIDFSTGLVTIPIGTEIGVKGKMVFAVLNEGSELCKIRIKRANRYHSLAEIIPMIGRPLGLKKFEEFDLVVL